jgi:hypothetical protein
LSKVEHGIEANRKRNNNRAKSESRSMGDEKAYSNNKHP